MMRNWPFSSIFCENDSFIKRRLLKLENYTQKQKTGGITTTTTLFGVFLRILRKKNHCFRFSLLFVFSNRAC